MFGRMKMMRFVQELKSELRFGVGCLKRGENSVNNSYKQVQKLEVLKDGSCVHEMI